MIKDIVLVLIEAAMLFAFGWFMGTLDAWIDWKKRQ